MINWQENVHRPFLISAKSGEAIQPGSTFYSALLFHNAEFVRKDYLESEWNEVDQDEILSWWKQHLPEVKDEHKQQMLNATILLGIFHDMKESTSRHEQCFLFTLALLLMRLKKLRYLDLVHEEDDDIIIMQDRSDKSCYRIRDPKMNEAEEEIVKNNLQKIFTMEASPETAAPEANANDTTDQAAAIVETELAE